MPEKKDAAAELSRLTEKRVNGDYSLPFRTEQMVINEIRRCRPLAASIHIRIVAWQESASRYRYCPSLVAAGALCSAVRWLEERICFHSLGNPRDIPLPAVPEDLFTANALLIQSAQCLPVYDFSQRPSSVVIGNLLAFAME